jgi:hypothetical protein
MHGPQFARQLGVRVLELRVARHGALALHRLDGACGLDPAAQATAVVPAWAWARRACDSATKSNG